MEGGWVHHVVAPGSLFHGGRHLERKLPRKEIAAATAAAGTTLFTTTHHPLKGAGGWRYKKGGGGWVVGPSSPPL